MWPVPEYQQSADELTVFGTLDESLVYLIPLVFYSQLEEFDLGAKKHLVQGKIHLGLEKSNYTKLKIKYPDVTSFEFVNSKTFERKVISWLENNDEHEISITEIPKVPYPEYIFSATLNTNTASYISTLERIRDEWSTKRLCLNKFSVTFDVTRLLGRCKISIDHGKIASIISDHANAKNLSSLEIMNLVLLSEDKGAYILSIDVASTEVQFIDYVRQRVSNHIENAHFGKSAEIISFSDGYHIEVHDALDITGVPVMERFDFIRSYQDNMNFTF